MTKPHLRCSRRIAPIAGGLTALLIAARPVVAEGPPEPATAPVRTSAPSFETVVEPPSPSPAVAPGQRPVPIAVLRPPPTPTRPACEDPEPMRAGFYLRILQGMGYAKFSGSGPGGSLSASGLGEHSTIAIGGGLARGLAIAGTLQSNTVEADLEGSPFTDATITARGANLSASRRAKLAQGLIGALVDWYPQSLGGFHGGVSAGFGAVSLTHNADGGQLAGLARSGSVFIGYDTAISRTWGFGLALVASGVTTASLKSSDGDDTGYKLEAYSIGVAASLLCF